MAVSSTRAANGDMVYLENYDADSAGFGSQWTGHVRFMPKYGWRGTTVDIWGLELAPLSSLGVAIESVRGVERERFSLSGGEVIIVDCYEPEKARWAAWMGPWHMVHGLFYQPNWESKDIVDVFSRVRWVDTPEGMTADPGDRFEFNAAWCLLPVPGVGTLHVRSKQSSATLVPQWRGASVPTGEVWQLSEPSGVGGAPSLVHVTGTAVTTLMPWDAPSARLNYQPTGEQGAGTAQRGLEFLGTVRRLDWVS
jgi:hypothetical protein